MAQMQGWYMCKKGASPTTLLKDDIFSAEVLNEKM